MISKSILRRFDPNFRSEVEQMKSSMDKSARLTMIGIDTKKIINNYLKNLYSKGYTTSYVDEILATASRELTAEHQLGELRSTSE